MQKAVLENRTAFLRDMTEIYWSRPALVIKADPGHLTWRGGGCLYVLCPIRSTKANIDKAAKKQYNIGKICLFGFSKYFQNFCDLTDYFSSR